MSEKEFEDIINLRRTLHSKAELSGNEIQTAEYIQNYIKQFNPHSIVRGLGGNGLAVVFKGEHSGPCVLLRCELDGLPIPETIELDYASKTPDVSHKCGHDGHMVILAGVAKQLHQNRIKRGSVILLFQPAEETGQGARLVLENPAFSEIQPDYVFALHNLPGFEEGQIIIKDGTFAAASIGMTVDLYGTSSHAGEPQKGKSPALALAKLIQDFSAIPQYCTSLSESAKVTVIHAKLGEEAFGTSPGYGRFAATIRAYKKSTMETIINKCTDLVRHISKSYGLEAKWAFTEEFPEVNNDSGATQIVKDAAKKLNLDTLLIEEAFPWSEDFGHFTNNYPGALFGIGSGVNHPALHNPSYDFPDAIIKIGSGLFLEIIHQILNNDLRD